MSSNVARKTISHPRYCTESSPGPPISALVSLQVHMRANWWNSTFPFNFNAKRTLQASGSMGVVMLGASKQASVCVCARACARTLSGGRVCLQERGNNELAYRHASSPVSDRLLFPRTVWCGCDRSVLFVRCVSVRYLRSCWSTAAGNVCVCMSAGRTRTLFSVLVTFS